MDSINKRVQGQAFLIREWIYRRNYIFSQRQEQIQQEEIDKSFNGLEANEIQQSHSNF